ncbi:hypothetical protein NUW54_g9617 [Trametes sanguinea]|uniref:Uncharacterized protein n=1 Tax=Trametes sanguinea TaxID=158606 RepID=A0ACC1P5Q3_9APHY|nr:hypothetical protein NUW54_g9617 [Trametes sanguinea]
MHATVRDAISPLSVPARAGPRCNRRSPRSAAASWAPAGSSGGGRRSAGAVAAGSSCASARARAKEDGGNGRGTGLGWERGLAKGLENERWRVQEVEEDEEGYREDAFADTA